jgi:tRNA uridine 5-carbamoylmethylation protein Kti12
MEFLKSLTKYPCEKIAYFIATPYEQCLINNSQRSRIVPEDVIKRMYLNIDIPAYFEGWNDIKFTWYKDNKIYNVDELFKKLDIFEQDNPHHTLTLGNHCRMCSNWIEHYFWLHDGKDYDSNIVTAGFIHDIGKPFTKQFKNGKGEVTDIAHYYNHMNVSAYDALFYLRDRYSNIDLLDICQLIRWHMQPYFIKDSTKATRKFINLVGEEFYDRLMILHEADKKAH